jgi:phage terminase small subunit
MTSSTRDRSSENGSSSVAKKGRPPKPTPTRRREGGTEKQGAISHRPLPEPVVVAGRNVPIAAPADIPEDARALWEEIVRQLAEAGIIDRIDLPMLREYCVQYARARQAARLIDEPVSEEELAELDHRIRENVAVSNGLKTKILEALRVGVDVAPAKISSLAKLETTIVNLQAYRHARAKVGNLVALGSTGQLTEHPAVDIERAAASVALRYATEFASTPTARARLGLAVLEGRSLQKELDEDLGPEAKR